MFKRKNHKIVTKKKNNDQKRWKRVYLHVLGMITNAVDELSWFDAVGTNFMDGGEKWEFLFHVLCLQHHINLSGSDWALVFSYLKNISIKSLKNISHL